ncbi:MAG: glycosyltransferase [Planctomycetaceae bacterium]
MKVLMAHSCYQYRGGEDMVFEREASLLESNNVEVIRYEKHNHDILDRGRIRAASRAFWNSGVYREVRELIRQHRVDVVHITNMMPGLSPSIYRAARSEKVPVVQSVHNFRLAGCLNGFFLRDSKVCCECSGQRFSWQGVLHGCYRNSRSQSLVAAASLALHRMINNDLQGIAAWIALTDFSRDELIRSGLPGDRIYVKPNFLEQNIEPGAGSGDYAVFAGRMSQEKGIMTMIRAWKILQDRGVAPPLKIVGDGPLLHEAVADAAHLPVVEFTGQLANDQTLNLLKSARCLIVPSEWYEVFPLVILEAYASGTPVIASGIGNLLSLVQDGSTGWHFRAGDAADLADVVERAFSDASFGTTMRAAARRSYEQIGGRNENFRQLSSIYQKAIGFGRSMCDDAQRVPQKM